jgi:hypothetical protein
MLTELTAATLIKLSVPERKELIYQKYLTIDATHIADEELHKAYKLSKVLQLILLDYFRFRLNKIIITK